MAECPNCGTEVRPEWSLCPHCKVNMRTYSGPRGGYVHPVTPTAPPAPVATTSAAPATTAPATTEPAPAATPAAAAPVVAAAPADAACPHCGAALPSPDIQFCPQCGEEISERSFVARMRRHLANPLLVGVLAVVFVALLAGLVLSGMGSDSGAAGSAKAASVGVVPSPTVTANAVVRNATVRNTTVATPAAAGRSAALKGNVTGNATPQAYETVLVVKTLDRYIQNAGGDPGSQIRTPATSPTPRPPTQVPTSASGAVGALSWSGEGTYVTDPFTLTAGTIQVGISSSVLTMVQLRDTAGTAVGIATGGPEPTTTAVLVPAAGTYRLEIWPFGAGTWTATLTYNVTTVPTLAPVVVTTAIPTANLTTEATTVAPTTVETTVTTEPTTEVTTAVTTAAPTATPAQERRNFTSDNSGYYSPELVLNAGLAVFTFSTEGTGPFSVKLIDPAGAEVAMIVDTDGPISSGSQSISVPTTGTYHLNIVAPGKWYVAIE